MKTKFWGLFLVCMVILFVSCNQKQIEKIAQLEDQIRLLETEIMPMKFKIKDKNPEELDVIIQFYDVNRNKIGEKQNIKIKGSELHFDFQVRKINSQYLIFPYAVFSDLIAPEEGLKIYSAYNKSDFPEIYNGMTTDASVNKILKELYQSSVNDLQTSKNCSKVSVHDLSGHKSFKKNIEYKVIFHPGTGAVEIL